MKTSKFFAIFMAVATLSFVACNSKDKDEPSSSSSSSDDTSALTLSATKASLAVGETLTITANKEVTWSVATSTNAVEIDTEKGTSVVVTAINTGAATVIASAGSEQEMCVITVTGEEDNPSTGTTISATEIYPVILDGVTFEANKDKVVSDFRVNDETNHLYIWTAGETYEAGEGAGLNYFGNLEGYVSLTVASAGWSGLGFNVGKDQASEVNAMVAKMAADPDSYFFHMGIKSVDNATHWFYLLGATPDCDVVVGPSDFNDNGTIHTTNYDFKRNGDWAEINVPMSSMANALAGINITSDVNILCALSGGVTGTQLDLDACYFYKK